MNPYSEGKLHKIGLDLFVKGFGPDRLVRAYMALTNTHETDRLILECATLAEMDDEYNDGAFLEEGIYEAVTVKRFSQTDSRMRALARVFAKHLPEGIAPAEAIIGKPRKTGLFANVTAQIPFSDGQAITIVFHSPSGDAKKIGPYDEIIAYRWLLNKRDITLVVSPEGEGEVSLEEVGKRIAQLVVKNSARFQTTQKDVKAQNDQLVTLKADADKLSTENVALMNGLRDQQSAAEITQTKITMTQGLIEKQQGINADLENQLAALQVKAKADEAARAMAAETAAKQAADEAAAAAAVVPVVPEVVPEVTPEEIAQEVVPEVTPEPVVKPDRATQIKKELDALTAKYEKTAKKFGKSGMVPPPIKIGILKGITDKMDKLDAELEAINNQPIVDKVETPGSLFIPAPDGTSDFGIIGPDIETASEGRFPSAPIRLEEGGAYGKSHIAEDRIKEFKANGYNDEIDALSDITRHYTEIYEQPNGRLLLVKRNGRGKFAAVELQNNGGYYGVTTWFLEDAKPKGKTPYEQRGGRKLLLRVAHADDPDQSPSFPAPVEEPGQPEDSRRSNESNLEDNIPPEETDVKSALATLNDLMSGAHDSDTVEYGRILKAAAGQLAAAGLMEKYNALLHQAADYRTGLLRKKAA
jgi:hypothetical protein